MKKVEVHPVLKQFLKEHSLLEAFIYNVVNENPHKTYVNTIHEAFCWDQTIEGHDFWYHTNNKFESYNDNQEGKRMSQVYDSKKFLGISMIIVLVIILILATVGIFKNLGT